jgi:hypothetical protein
MKFRTLMIIKAIVCASFGVFILFAPGTIYTILGISLNPAGYIPARQYAASLFGNLMLTWIAKDSTESVARRAIIVALCVYDAIGFIVTLIALLTGQMNALGWAIAALYLFLALGFGYFWMKEPK